MSSVLGVATSVTSASHTVLVDTFILYEADFDQWVKFNRVSINSAESSPSSARFERDQADATFAVEVFSVKK